MRILMGMTLIGGLVIASSLRWRSGRAARAEARGEADPDDLVARMMEFDKDKDGKLTKDEVTDERLIRLFDRADAEQGRDGHQRGADRPGDPGASERPWRSRRVRRPPGGGASAVLAPPGFGPPRPGVILPPMLQQRLNLSDRTEGAGRGPPEGSGRQAGKDPQRRATDAAQGDARARPWRLRTPARRTPARRTRRVRPSSGSRSRPARW